MKFAELEPEQKAKVVIIADAVTDMLNEYADLIETGDLPYMPGPQLLRWVGRAINEVIIRSGE